MANVIATFSNGFKDEYKGRRGVKAAWMVTLDGKVIKSGHSMDVTKAAKTGRSNLTREAEVIYFPRYFQSTVSGLKVARKAGFRTTREYNAHVKAVNATNAEKYKLEVITL